MRVVVVVMMMMITGCDCHIVTDVLEWECLLSLYITQFGTKMTGQTKWTEKG